MKCTVKFCNSFLVFHWWWGFSFVRRARFPASRSSFGTGSHRDENAFMNDESEGDRRDEADRNAPYCMHCEQSYTVSSKLEKAAWQPCPETGCARRSSSLVRRVTLFAWKRVGNGVPMWRDGPTLRRWAQHERCVAQTDESQQSPRCTRLQHPFSWQQVDQES